MNPPVLIRKLTGATAEAALLHVPQTGFAILYKHSFRCGISLTSREELEIFAVARPDVPIFELDVVAQRSISQALATLLSVRHASPQVILLRDRLPIWSATHHRITASALTAAVADEPDESTGRRGS
ncbi:MAG: monothiol bacilliredoxin BrxC family protein [Gemmatimonadales bacterium]